MTTTSIHPTADFEKSDPLAKRCRIEMSKSPAAGLGRRRFSV
jgi:hypothetical protein